VNKFQKSRATVDGHHKLFIKLYSEQTTLDEPYKVFVFEHPRPNPHFTVIAKHIKTNKRNFELKFSPMENDTVKSILSESNSSSTQKSKKPLKPLSIDPWTLKKIFSNVYIDKSGKGHISPLPQPTQNHLKKPSNNILSSNSDYPGSDHSNPSISRQQSSDSNNSSHTHNHPGLMNAELGSLDHIDEEDSNPLFSSDISDENEAKIKIGFGPKEFSGKKGRDRGGGPKSSEDDGGP
jgi:hypothetical protein